MARRNIVRRARWRSDPARVAPGQAPHGRFISHEVGVLDTYES
jgi:hypothetical protein